MTADQRNNARSQAAQQYRSLYNSRGWKRIRREQLELHPLCQCPHCQEGKVRTRPATVVDHRRPHHGNPSLFFDRKNLQSMAKDCHDSFKQSQERGGKGFQSACDAQGVPIDPGHHWNRPGGA